MAIDRIFDTEKLREEGNEIKSCANHMYEDLQSIKREMESSTSCFDSKAGEDLRANFNHSASKFEEFKKLMDDYGNYLISLAQQKEEMERNLSQAGTNIPVL